FLFLYVPPTPVSYTLSLHDALPIFDGQDARSVDVDLATRSRQGFAHLPENVDAAGPGLRQRLAHDGGGDAGDLDVHLQRGDALRSEEHTSELQSRENLVCRLLLEKK